MLFKKLGDVLVRLGIGVISLSGIAISIIVVILLWKDAYLLGIFLGLIGIIVFGVVFLGILLSFFKEEYKE